MTWVALALVVANALVVASFARVLTRRDRQHARERDLLLNQMLNMAGKPWNPAPASEPKQLVPVPDAGRYSARPETLPE